MTQTTPVQERYTRFSCPNPQCTRFNHPGEGNIVHRSWTGTHKHIERLRCTACDREFSAREGTLMARSKLPEATVVRLVTCQRWGVCDEGTADICAVDLKTVHRFQHPVRGLSSSCLCPGRLLPPPASGLPDQALLIHSGQGIAGHLSGHRGAYRDRRHTASGGSLPAGTERDDRYE